MKKNKYVVFAMIGFELVALILIALWLGGLLAKKGFDSTISQTVCVLMAFFIWFVSLIMKLKGLKND
ncbi:MAG: hypothetical protein H7061_11190 [Bdellovibrionaceae bacterium]|nr:hypothetical protein [Bdellovibrio sp.]